MLPPSGMGKPQGVVTLPLVLTLCDVEATGEVEITGRRLGVQITGRDVTEHVFTTVTNNTRLPSKT